MYLVMLRYAADDFPIRLVSTEKEARFIAESIGWDVPEHVRRILSIDASEPAAICIYQFDISGLLHGAKLIRSFEGDDRGGDPVEPAPDPPNPTELVTA